MDGPETFKQFVTKNTAAGQYPSTEWQLRGLHRYRKENGLSDAFVQIGSRWLVKRARFNELICKRSRASVVA